MKEGIILLGHGSRREEANQEVKRLAEMIQEDLDQKKEEVPCRVAFLSFGSPDLEEAVDSLVQNGVERVIVTPYFLVTGNHIKKDIPEELERIQQKHSGTKMILASHLGPHPDLIGIVQQRINEARELI